ncbi:lysis protein, partial [Photorhabdus sp. S8-52]|uniref:lysis protein n=5 Tax=Photorhabdus TaxID=29487 RepID=UPI0011BDE14E
LDTSIKLQSELLEQQNEIVNQQERIRRLSELDNQHTKELANAKSEIDALRDDVAAGRRRLLVKATCPVSETASSTGLDGSRPARLEKDAEQDYLRLLGELETLEAQFLGLRDYMKTECRGNDGNK